MNNINLLPKVPTIQRIFIPVVLSCVFLFIMVASMIYFFSFHIRSEISQTNTQTGSDQAIIKQLTQARQIDPLTKDVQTFSSAIDKLKQTRRDWIPVIEAISAQLPNNSRLINLTADDTNSLSASFEFAGIADVAHYILSLQSNPLMKSIVAKEITRTDKLLDTTGSNETTNTKKNNQPEPSATGAKTIAQAPASGSQSHSDVSDPTDEIIRMMEQGLVKGNSEGDQLLNQLTWLVNEQLVKEKYGVDIQDMTALNQLKSKQKAKLEAKAAEEKQASQPPGSLNINPPPIASTDSGSALASSKVVSVYTVKLNFTLNSTGGK